jgi:FkbM family methyltransferase
MKWLVSAGVHDRHSEVYEFDHAAVEAALVRITPPAWFAHRPGGWDVEMFPWVAGWHDEYRLGKTDMTGWTVVDLGGHIGSFVLAAHDRGARIIHSYEPNATTFTFLKQNAAYLGAVAFNEGVSDKPGVCRSEPWNGDMAHTGGYRAIIGEGDVPVVGIRTVLSRARAASADGWVDLLKLDCEAAEFPILEAENLDLSFVRSVVGEAHGGIKARELLGRDYQLSSVVPLLEKHGFQVVLQQGSRGDEDGLFWATRPA